jgi:hypothetical protein
VNENRLQLLGWMMFTASGVFFLIDALESGDKTALGSAITWLLGVGFFLVKSKAPDDE